MKCLYPYVIVLLSQDQKKIRVYCGRHKKDMFFHPVMRLKDLLQQANVEFDRTNLEVVKKYSKTWEKVDSLDLFKEDDYAKFCLKEVKLMCRLYICIHMYNVMCEKRFAHWHLVLCSLKL